MAVTTDTVLTAAGSTKDVRWQLEKAVGRRPVAIGLIGGGACVFYPRNMSDDKDTVVGMDSESRVVIVHLLGEPGTAEPKHPMIIISGEVTSR